MLKSFSYAGKGIVVLFTKENNAQFHLLASIVAVILSIYFKIERWEWFAVTVSVFFVFSAEAFNTAIEKICDKFHPERDTTVGSIKDLAAAGVLFAAISAFITAVVIFGERISNLIF